MSMLDEIEKLMGEIGSSAYYRIINLGGNSLYVEGIKSVISFSEEEMRFQLKKQIIVIKGEQLKIKYLDKTTCVINGNILVVETK